MKAVCFTLSLFLLVSTGFAANPAAPKRSLMYASPSFDNVKLFCQPGTSTPVLKVLSRTDHVQVLRAHNKTWSIITIDNQVGYVLTSEINWDSSYKQLTHNAAIAKRK